MDGVRRSGARSGFSETTPKTREVSRRRARNPKTASPRPARTFLSRQQLRSLRRSAGARRLSDAIRERLDAVLAEPARELPSNRLAELRSLLESLNHHVHHAHLAQRTPPDNIARILDQISALLPEIPMQPLAPSREVGPFDQRVDVRLFPEQRDAIEALALPGSRSAVLRQLLFTGKGVGSNATAALDALRQTAPNIGQICSLLKKGSIAPPEAITQALDRYRAALAELYRSER